MEVMTSSFSLIFKGLHYTMIKETESILDLFLWNCSMPIHDGLVKSLIFPFSGFPPAGMTIRHLISDRYYRRHTREGGYPVFKKTFCDIIIHGLLSK